MKAVEVTYFAHRGAWRVQIEYDNGEKSRHTCSNESDAHAMAKHFEDEFMPICTDCHRRIEVGHERYGRCPECAVAVDRDMETERRVKERREERGR